MSAVNRSRRWIMVRGAAAGLSLAGATASFAQAPTSLVVTVIDDAAPVAEVRVLVRSALLASGQLLAMTDADGVVIFDLPSAGLYDVVIEQEGFFRALATDTRVNENEVNHVSIVVTRRPSGAGSY